MQVLTPRGQAGVAVVCAAPAERARLLDMLRTVRGGIFESRPGAPPRRAVLHLGGAALDDVLVVDRVARGLEVHVHGAPIVLEALAAHFPVEPVPAASPAEDLVRRAMSEGQLELALEQVDFDLAAFAASLAALPSPVRAQQFAAFRRRSRVARAHAAPERLVLAGAQNAGKSSLFNALLFRERALTGPQPGLTRDPISECTVLDGYPYELLDTAGEGPAASAVDAIALAAARRARQTAAVVLVVDGAVGPSPSDRALAPGALLVVRNKCDLPPARWPDDVPHHVSVSCVGEDPAAVRTLVGVALRCRRELPPAGRVGGAAALDGDQEALVAAAVARCGT